MRTVFACMMLLHLSLFLADGVQPAGSGTQADPYQVATLDNLLWISTNSTSWSSYFIQTANIDASNTQTWNGGEGFSPIGNLTTSFQGTYNGQNHTIDHLHIARPSASHQALFGYTGSASTIHQLGVTNVEIEGMEMVGGIVGLSYSSIDSCWTSGHVAGQNIVGGIGGFQGGIITNCNSGCYVEGVFDVGGIMGTNGGLPDRFTQTEHDSPLFNPSYSRGVIGECTFSGSAIGDNYVGGIAAFLVPGLVIYCRNTGVIIAFNTNAGGIAGANGYGTEINSCINEGAVTGGSIVGGIVSYISPYYINGSPVWPEPSYGTVVKCRNTGNISGTGTVGGIVGTSSQLTVSLCYNEGTVESDSEAGGIASGLYQYANINNCYNTGSIECANKVGGLVGSINPNSSIENSYSSGNVTGDTDVGGLVGYADYGTTVSASFWDTETSGQNTSAGGTGLPTEDMKDITTYTNAGWDFQGEIINGTADIWNIDPTINNGYPYFGWQTPVPLPVELSSFTAAQTSENFACLTWITQSETDMCGYNLYRCSSNNLIQAERVNTQIIPAENSSSGSSYSYEDINVIVSNTYYYWLESVELSGQTTHYGPASITLIPEDQQDDLPVIVADTILHGNYPNPFNPATTIRYNVATGHSASLIIYNVRGQRVCGWEEIGPGVYEVLWNGRDDNGRMMSSGVYFCRLSSDDRVMTHKMLLLK